MQFWRFCNKTTQVGRPVLYVFCNMAAEMKKDAKMAVFNSEEIEKLIDLWHKEPVLYNCQSGVYMNKVARAAAAGRIFVALEKEGELIRTTRTEGGETEVDTNNIFKPLLYVYLYPPVKRT